MSLESYSVDRRRSQFETPAPVNGGMRWRAVYGGLADYNRRAPAPQEEAGDHARSGEESSAPAPVPARGPYFTFTPPAEARVGEEYVVQAKAFDPCIVGFNWFFRKDCCPPGMTVDRYGGEIRWTPSEGGYFEVTLGCSTVHGNVAYLTWTICVRKAPAVRTSVPHPRFQSALRRKTALFRVPRRFCRVWRQPRPDLNPASRPAAPPGAVRAVPYAMRV